MKILSPEWVGYGWLARAALLTLLILMGLMVVLMRWWDFSGMFAFMLLFMVYLYIKDGLPLIYDFLVCCSLLMNVLGWVYDYYHSISIYDEIAHCFTSFTLSSMVGVYLIRPWNIEQGKRHIHTAILYFLMAMGIGALWEMIEWIAFLVTSDHKIIKSLEDTILDLFWNGLGSLLSLPLFFLTRVQHQSNEKSGLIKRLREFFGFASRVNR